MTIKNNYTKAETGPSIELVCFYDTSLSQMLFDENISVIQHSSYTKKSMGYYIDNGNLPGPEDVKFSVSGTYTAMAQYLKKEWNLEGKDLPRKKADRADLCYEYLCRHESPSLLNYTELGYDHGGVKLEIVPNKRIESFSTSGYSQGDYAEVFYSPEDIERVWGTKPNEKAIQEIVSHYYWDAPIYACFDIDGKEYHYHDMPEYDEYEWDRDAFIAYVSKESGIDIETLEKFVPDYPSYS
jgi:hypothetical protein